MKPTENLTQDQETVIKVLQDFYREYNRHPSMRILIKNLAEKKNWDISKANSIYLYNIFSPEEPIKQASLLGGLPKPLKCL